MAGGANQLFLDEKEQFLKANLIEVNVAARMLITVARFNVDATKAPLASAGRLGRTGLARQISTDDKAAGVFDFDLVKSPTKAQLIKNGRQTEVPMYQLKAWGDKVRDRTAKPDGTVEYRKPKHAHPITAYWVPWNPNSCYSARLGTQADFFFTAAMDGCSLAISSGASPVVTHANYKSKTRPDVASESRTMRHIQQRHADLGVDVAVSLRKSQYVASSAQKQQGINKLVTVVGFRDPVTNSWSFYWQRHKVIYGDATIGTHTQHVLTDRLVPLV